MSEEAAGVARVVVGVDGSESSKEALRWAVRYATGIGGVVEAVIAWEYPVGWYGWTPPVDDEFTFEGNTAKVLTEAIDEALGADRPVEIRTRVVQGNAAGSLLEASRGAELLVVGNRGHSGFTEALLGSVSQHCVQHADCPVVVVRGTKK